MFRSIRWMIAIPFVIATALGVFIFGLFIGRQIYNSQLTSFTNLVIDQTQYIASLLVGLSSMDQWTEHIDSAANQFPTAQFRLINEDGMIVHAAPDSSLQQTGLNALPEITGALDGITTTDTRQGEDRENRIFIGEPLQSPVFSGVLQASFSTQFIDNTVRFVWFGTIAATISVSIAILFIASFIAERSFRPLRDLTRTAQEIADVDNGMETHFRRDELSQLTLAFNTMSGQLRSQIDALKTERSKLSAVLQQMTDGVVIADRHGRIQLFNESAERIFEIHEQNAMDRGLAEVLRDHRLVELWEKCISSGKEQAVYLEFRQPNIFLQCIATPLQESLPGSVLLLFQDLTRLRRLETVRRDFISNISHELRTPLASLKALAETLQDGALEDPPAARHFLAQMETEVDALGHMVSELLELTRIESGKVPLQLKPERPIDLLIAARDRLYVQAERSNLTLQINCAKDLPLVLADSPRMQQVVVNLLHNAIKFTPPGGRIEIGAYQETDHVIFFVEDTGVGIPADDLSRIFERFYKADRARSGGGTGLGLAISRHLVEAHGGRIWVDSIETKGSRFSFSLLSP